LKGRYYNLETIEVNQLEANFKHEVGKHPGGEAIKACFACGACTGGCPASDVDPSYDPRKIIRMILLGMKERVLSSDIIWLCSMCFTCSFHCPQDVQFVKVMGVLREMAVKAGYADPSFLKNMEQIDRFSQTIRHDMVLSIVDRKKEDFSVNPTEQLKAVVDKL
jgi:heterodisulfide reductase subunit C